MLPISTKTPHRLEVRGDPSTTYLIRVPTRRERIAFDHAVMAAGARISTDADILRALRDGIKALVADEQQAELLAIVDSYEAVPLPRTDLDPKLRDDIEEISRVVRARYPRFAAAETDAANYINVASVTAAGMFLVGRDGERPFARRGGVVAEEVMEDLPDAHVALIGLKAMELMRPREDAEKNSASGSPSSASPEPSATTSPKPSPSGDGKSAESTTSAIPA